MAQKNSTSKAVMNGQILKQQSIPVEGEECCRRSAISEKLIATFYDDVTTAYEGFLRGLRISRDNPCIGKLDPSTSGYRWLTYNQVHERATNAGSGLITLGFEPSQNTFVGIFSKNSEEYVITDLACQMHSMIPVPIYDTHGPEACVHIINHAEVKVIVCQPIKLSFLLENAKQCPQFKKIIKTESEVTDEEKEEAKQLGIEILSFTELEKIGKNKVHERNPGKPDDINTICYTSGTTGTPKGAMITNKSLIAALSGAAFQYYQKGIEILPTDSYLSYLPMAHIYERIATVMMFVGGARLGLYRGDPKLLIEDIQTLKPTMFATVPRILNRVYDKVMAQISESKLKSWLFDRALRSKENDLKKNISRGDTLWDKLVFKKVQNLFGGKLRIVLSTSAPLSAKVMMFFKCSLGKCIMVEGYGQTENSAACTIQFPDDLTAGHVGCPLPCSMIKLVDVPEKGYYAKDRKGEICIKGHNVFKGYFKDPEKTAETIDGDGWLHTGDVGEFLENGTLRIIDRSKNIFKLAQGEYVAPEKIEIVCSRSFYVEQIFVHGETLKSYVVAVVVPDDDMLTLLAKQLQIKGDRKVLCTNQEIRKVIFDDILKKTKEDQLNSFEKPKAIYLHPEPFTPENGLLTPTLKAKRPTILKHFRQQIDDLYVEADTILKFNHSPSENTIKLEIGSSK